MSEISMKRRFAGRALLVTGALALPLTASISYAEVAQHDVPAAPAAPLAPIAAQQSSLAPEAPTPPQPPEAPDHSSAPQVIVLPTSDEADEAEDKGKRKVVMYRHEKTNADGDIVKSVERSIVAAGTPMTSEERAAILREVEQAMAEARDGIEEARGEIHLAIAQVDAQSASGATRVELRCKDNAPVTEEIDRSGATRIFICQSAIMAEAIQGLKQAREEIAEAEEFPSDMRERVLQTLDERIDSLTEQS